MQSSPIIGWVRHTSNTNIIKVDVIWFKVVVSYASHSLLSTRIINNKKLLSIIFKVRFIEVWFLYSKIHTSKTCSLTCFDKYTELLITTESGYTVFTLPQLVLPYLFADGPSPPTLSGHPLIWLLSL